jgi:CrcB protein
LLATGFCGAYTTFSTFTYESVRLLEDGQLLEAAGNVAVGVAVGLGAAALGLAIGLAL